MTPRASFTTATHGRKAKPTVSISMKNTHFGSDHKAKGIKPQLEKSNLEWKRVLSRYRDHGQHQPEALLSRHRHPAVRGRSGCRVSWTSQMAQFSYRRCSWSFMVKGGIRSSKFRRKRFVVSTFVHFLECGNSVTLLSFLPFSCQKMADMLFCPSPKAVNLLTSSGTATCSSSQMESRVCIHLIPSRP